jgi:hypothetical protein
MALQVFQNKKIKVSKFLGMVCFFSVILSLALILNFAPDKKTKIAKADIVSYTIWDGSLPTYLKYATTITSADCYEGGSCLQGNAINSSWIVPELRLCDATYPVLPSCNKVLTGYDEIQFWAKSSSAGSTFGFSVITAAGTSTSVNINPYIQGGPLDTTWKLVKIPISVLQTAGYNPASTLKTFYFNNSSPTNDNHQIYIDSITAVQLSAPPCVSNWTCSWSACVDGSQTRTCTDANSCVPPNPPMPDLTQSCGTTPDRKGTLLWDGESTESRAGKVFTNGSATDREAYAGGYSFEGTGLWGTPNISLIDQPMYKHGISQYDELWFYAKSNTSNNNINFSINDYGSRTSNIINVNNYIEGGQLDTTWKLVRIPIRDLKTSVYPLEIVNSFSFVINPNDSGDKIYIDDIYAVNINPETVTDYKFLSDNVIRLETSQRYDFDSVINPLNYSLSGINPVQVGRQFYASSFVRSDSKMYGNAYDPVTTSYIYLVFNNSMTNENPYTLTINSLKNSFGRDLNSPIQINFTYLENSLDNIAGSVKASQVGYTPTSTKIGYAGNYLGDLGALNITPATCEVINSLNGLSVGTFSMSYRGTDLQMFGENIYTCDFSSVETPGTYFLYVPGVGRTYDFRIADDVYNDVAKKVSKFLYYQRAGIDIVEPYSEGYSRAGGHKVTDTQAVIQTNTTNPTPGPKYGQKNSQVLSPLYNGETGTVSMPRGWYDAADFGKYVKTGVPALDNIFTAFEMFPQKFPDNALNIPESGNGVPDILDEAKWEIDWLKEMQAPDGGVWQKVNTFDWGKGMPVDDVAPRLIAEKDTHSTAMYAAVLAKAYRILKPYFPSYADDLLVRSTKAYQFLKLHPETVNFSYIGGCRGNPWDIGGGNGDKICRVDDQERAWAAAELYKTTGDPLYATDFITYWNRTSTARGDTSVLNSGQRRASFTYATTTAYPTNNTIITKIKNELINDEANHRKDLSGATVVWNNLYRSCGPLNDPMRIGWGFFAETSMYSWELIKAYYLTNDTSYLTTAKLCLDTQLGSNPQYLSYITGVGHDYPREPLQAQSILDKIPEPIPGIPVYGPIHHMSNSVDLWIETQSYANLYPKGNLITEPYPITRRYYDNLSAPMDEFTIYESSFNATTYTILSNVIRGPAPRCQEKWTCPEWALSPCVNGIQTRICTDLNGCGTDPIFPQYCSTVTTLPITTITPNGGNFTTSVSVSLSSNKPTNTIYYCLGDTCTNYAQYSLPFSLTATTTVRYYSVDATAGNTETVKTTTFTLCTSNCTSAFTTTLKLGMRGPAVTDLQKFLNNNGYNNGCPGTLCQVSTIAGSPGSPGHETSTFSLKTWTAVKRFQTYYKEQILIPNGLIRATGLVARATLAQINYLINLNP